MRKKIKYQIKTLKTHRDKRGWLVELLKADELAKPVKQIYVASIKTGQLRANHYHSKRIEWFFVISGRAQLLLKDPKIQGKICLHLSGQKPRVITIFPGVAHAIKNTGQETVYFLGAQSSFYHPKNPDTFPYKID